MSIAERMAEAEGSLEAIGMQRARVDRGVTDAPELDFKGLPLSIKAATAVPGQRYWRIRRAIALPPNESRDIHNVYLRCFRQGERQLNVMVRQFWPGGEARGQTEAKPLDEWGDWNAPLFGDWKPEEGPGPYGVEVVDGTPSEALLGMGLPRKQHFSYRVEFEERVRPAIVPVPDPEPMPPDPGEPPPIPSPDPAPVGPLRASLLAAGEHHQVLRLNPGAALQKVILRDGFVPTSPEFGLHEGGLQYVAQRAERLRDGAVRVYYCRVGEWQTVNFAER